MTDTSSGRRPGLSPKHKIAVVTSAFAAAAFLTGVTGTTNQQVTQAFQPPVVGSKKAAVQIAQARSKSPALAPSEPISTTTLESLLPIDPLSTGATSLSTTNAIPVYETKISTAAIEAIFSPPSGVSVGPLPDPLTTGTPLSSSLLDTTTSSRGLEGLLFTSPVVADYLSTSVLDSISATTMPESLDLDLNVGEAALDEFLLPNQALPLADLERLTSSSRISKRVTVMNVLCQALQVNQNLRVEQLRPEVSNASIEQAWGEFDTNFFARTNYGVRHSPSLTSSFNGSTTVPISGGGGDDEVIDNVTRTFTAETGVQGRLPTGTNYGLTFATTRTSGSFRDELYNSTLNLNITQNLLRGAGCDVNLVRVWTAQNNFVISLYQLQQVLINLTTDVQLSYWDLYLAWRTLDIRKAAYRVAREQREQAEEFVRVGRSAPLDALAAQAEEASRISDLINAVADLKRQQLTMLRLINPECLDRGWTSLLFPVERPILPSERVVAEDRVRLARYYRPDLRQAQIDLANGELEVIRTENGLLPQLDFVSNFGLAGIGGSFRDSQEMLRTRDFPNYNIGFEFNFPLQNRVARAAYRRANFQRALAEQAIGNFCQIIDVDVRNAIVEIERTRRLIDSTQVTEILRQRTLEAEIERFRVGRSTQVQVNQVQRDLITAQLDSVTAVVNHIKAYISLYRAEGTALQRRGIEPVRITPESGVP